MKITNVAQLDRKLDMVAGPGSQVIFKPNNLQCCFLFTGSNYQLIPNFGPIPTIFQCPDNFRADIELYYTVTCLLYVVVISNTFIVHTTYTLRNTTITRTGLAVVQVQSSMKPPQPPSATPLGGRTRGSGRAWPLPIEKQAVIWSRSNHRMSLCILMPDTVYW